MQSFYENEGRSQPEGGALLAGLLLFFGFIAIYTWNMAMAYQPLHEDPLLDVDFMPEEESPEKTPMRFTLPLNVDSPKPEPDPEENKVELWKPYSTPAIESALKKAQSNLEPKRELILNAYLDVDAEALRRQEGASIQVANRHKRTLKKRLKALIAKSRPRDGETAADLLGRINRLLHAQPGLSYKWDQNTMAAYVANNQIQCLSGSTLAMVIWTAHAHHFPEATPVFAHSPAHVQPGLVVDGKLWVTESTAQSGQIGSIDLKKLENVQLSKALGSLMAVSARAAGKPEIYPEDRALYFKGHSIQHLHSESTTPSPLPLSLLSISGPTPKHEGALSMTADPIDTLTQDPQKRMSPTTSKNPVDSFLDDLNLSDVIEDSQINLVPLTESQQMKIPTIAPEEKTNETDAIQRRLQFCYKRHLLRDPNLSGSLTMHFKTNAQGQVIKSQIGFSTLRNKSLEQCLMAAIKRTTFPKEIKQGSHVRRFEFNPVSRTLSVTEWPSKRDN